MPYPKTGESLDEHHNYWQLSCIMAVDVAGVDRVVILKSFPYNRDDLVKYWSHIINCKIGWDVQRTPQGNGHSGTY